ncbi:MAG: hypothetical protein DME19_01685, partial [Verrucomicrobia bacterium]
PLIGSNVPVHGLVMDIETGRLEWLVNGYQTLGAAAPSFVEAFKQTAAETVKQTAVEALNLVATKLPEFKLGEMKFPEFKIGETTIDPNKWLSEVQAVAPAESAPQQTESAPQPLNELERKFDQTRRYRVIGADQKVYGPIDGGKILEWIADGRIDWQTASQIEGSGEWKPLSVWAAGPKPPGARR